jgi:hypothetical protein
VTLTPTPILPSAVPVYDAVNEYADDVAAAYAAIVERAALAEARADALEVDLAECRDEKPEEPTDPPTATVFGASPGKWPIPGVDKLDGYRAYLGGGEDPTSWSQWSHTENATDRTVKGGTIWLSWKVGGTDWLDELLGSAPKGYRYIGTYNHEPENDTPPDAAAYQRVWAEQLPVLRRHGWKSADCLLGHLTDAQNEPFHVKEADYVGFDRYNPGLRFAKRYADPAQVFARVLAYGRRKRKPIAFGEVGTVAVGHDPVTGLGGDLAGRREWARKLRAHLAAQPDVPVALWWNQSRMSLAADAALARVWLDGAAA